MRPVPIAPGQTFGRLTAVRPVESTEQGARQWECLCACGTLKICRAGLLGAGDTKSCGCLRRDAFRRIDLLKQIIASSSDACVEWRFNPSPQGYGHLHYMGRSHVASRIAYEISVGRIPGGLMVLHSCDNPACVNPKHLFLGTALDNNRDRCAKGRSALGERSGRSCLTTEQVLAIRSLRDSGFLISALAEKFGVAKTTILQVVSLRTWRHIEANEFSKASVA